MCLQEQLDSLTIVESVSVLKSHRVVSKWHVSLSVDYPILCNSVFALSSVNVILLTNASSFNVFYLEINSGGARSYLQNTLKLILDVLAEAILEYYHQLSH